MNADLALAGVLAAPLGRAALVLALARPPGLRDTLSVALALLGAVCSLYLVGAASAGESARIVLARPLPQVDLAFIVEPFGALATALMSCLAAVHAVHTSGMVRATEEHAPARMTAFIALACAAGVAVALSANLFSLFVAYQALTLATFTLVAHKGDQDARNAAGAYLATLLAPSAAFFLPAMVWTYSAAGVLEFAPGGVLAGQVDTATANVLLLLFVFGLAMAAIPPFHRWMPRASVAPFPALASIYAISVLPAGGAAMFKVVAFVFGPALADAALAAQALIALCGAGMCVFALVALSKQDIRERLAYSSIAQSLAVTLGVLLALPAGLFASALHIVAFSCAAATLAMAAGTAEAVTGRVLVGEYAGLGRVMPWTFAGFAIASASMIGMPPFAGAWAKLWLITASAGAGLIWAAALAGIAAVLTFAHLGPLAASALAGQAPQDAFRRPDGASASLVAPVVLSAAATLLLLALADPLASYLSPVWTAPP